MALPLLAGGLMAAGLFGSLTAKRPKYDSTAMDNAYRLIQDQYANVDKYFNEAGTAFESQYKNYYSNTMQDAVNKLAGSGLYESPVGQKQLNKQQVALGETYMAGKSELAGQKMQAIGSIDQQKISYYQNLANIQYQQQVEKANRKKGLFGAIGGLGGSLLGI